MEGVDLQVADAWVIRSMGRICERKRCHLLTVARCLLSGWYPFSDERFHKVLPLNTLDHGYRECGFMRWLCTASTVTLIPLIVPGEWLSWKYYSHIKFLAKSSNLYTSTYLVAFYVCRVKKNKELWIPPEEAVCLPCMATREGGYGTLEGWGKLEMRFQPTNMPSLCPNIHPKTGGYHWPMVANRLCSFDLIKKKAQSRLEWCQLLTNLS